MSTVLRVGAQAPSFKGDALFFDGVRAAPRTMVVSIDERQRRLIGPGLDWPLADIRELPDQAADDLIVLRREGDPLARLILTDPLIRPRLPERSKSAPAANRGRLTAWAFAAVASVALIIFVLVPVMADQLAEFIPADGEKALGEVTLTQIRDAMDDTGVTPAHFCVAQDGRAALDIIETRLTRPMDLPVRLTVHVLDHDMVNAFALPGGHIVLFRGLIEAAGTPEELASVFAHEIGHVVSRDPTRHALRSAGAIGVLGLIFGDFAGGAVVLLLAEQLIEAQYSQSAEAAADAFAHDMMRRAELSPDALAAMFERFREMGGDTGGILAHFLSHPALGDRIAAARDATPAGFASKPLLRDTEWAALKNICAQTEP